MSVAVFLVRFAAELAVFTLAAGLVAALWLRELGRIVVGRLRA